MIHHRCPMLLTAIQLYFRREREVIFVNIFVPASMSHHRSNNNYRFWVWVANGRLWWEEERREPEIVDTKMEKVHYRDDNDSLMTLTFLRHHHYYYYYYYHYCYELLLLLQGVVPDVFVVFLVLVLFDGVVWLEILPWPVRP